MIHIVNGDSIGSKLHAAGVQGEVLVWREMYTFGPVSLQPELAENRLRRAAYMEQAFGISPLEWISSAEAQERPLAAFREHREIVLWFEHDLYDQTMLSCLLRWFALQHVGSTKLYLLSIDQFPGIDLFHGLGQLTPAELSTLNHTWSEISDKQLALGKKAWEAYVADHPMAIVELLKEDTSALPFLHDAFQLHLGRYPSVRNGLGLVEQTTLELLAAKCHTPVQLFQQISNKHHRLGLGDLQYWFMLKQLSEGRDPLICIENDVPTPGLHDSPDQFLQAKIHLNERGEEVLACRNEWARPSGCGSWLGGFFLGDNRSQWRWDDVNAVILQK
ncbi:hypothetical protein FHS16_002837 [Paenibacillus endophyticus]|uniref:DUF1835 domain-containing protein n=1 Tax=Paenibacillus endophyticus TaxID=1294268 RepID=A0A7W5C7W5_9BACL|nr:DUF1835 domain-containing protein [Paenibacillus endophyticus]MBB3152780.1 hypothetical protein [Paenibacillus endophyticus]